MQKLLIGIWASVLTQSKTSGGLEVAVRLKLDILEGTLTASLLKNALWEIRVHWALKFQF